MSNYSSIKSTIASNIRANGNEEITGDILGSVLQQMVTALGAYQFAGVAAPASNPGTPDINVFYLANTAGTYTNLGGFTLSTGEVAAFTYDGSWAKVSLPVKYVDVASSQSITGEKTFSGGITILANPVDLESWALLTAGGTDLQSELDDLFESISAKQDANLVTSISSASTDTQYPSAKCVYDIVGDIDTLLQALL